MGVALLRGIGVGHAQVTAAAVHTRRTIQADLRQPRFAADPKAPDPKCRRHFEVVDLVVNLRYHDDGLIK